MGFNRGMLDFDICLSRNMIREISFIPLFWYCFWHQNSRDLFPIQSSAKRDMYVSMFVFRHPTSSQLVFICPYQNHILKTFQKYKVHIAQCREKTLAMKSMYQKNASRIDVCVFNQSHHFPKEIMVQHLQMCSCNPHWTPERENSLQPGWRIKVKNHA